MSNVFFVNISEDGNEQYVTYDDFVSELGMLSKIQLHHREPNEYSYFVNLTSAIIHQIDLTIVDLDFSENEVETKLGTNYKKESITVLPFGTRFTFEQMCELVLNSKSVLSIFTSGTTGLPKKVDQSVKNLLREVRIGEQYMGDRWAYAYNPTHIAGLQLFFQCLLNKNLMVNVFAKSRSLVLQALRKFSITNISATPSFYRLLMPVDNKFEQVRKLTLGGERSDVDLISKLKEMFPYAKINNIYATTEFGTILSSEGDVFVIKPKYKEFVRINEGVLEVHFSLLGKTQDLKLDGDWYSTGDIIEFVDDTDTKFKFIGRKNDLINVGGNKVNPQDVESELLKIPAIKECVVYGRPNSVLGNVVCAEVVLFFGVEITESEIKEILRDKLQNFKIPRKFIFTNRLAKNRANKIERKK